MPFNEGHKQPAMLWGCVSLIPGSNIISKRFKLCPKIFVATVQFCKWFRPVVCSDEIDSLLSYITDEIIRTVKQLVGGVSENNTRGTVT
jgi:hypothetical protein